MKLARVGLAALLAGAFLASAQDKPCSKADAAAAEKAVERVVMWDQMHKAWKDYSHCDTGNVADLYTDALMRLLVDWKKPEALADTWSRDAQYKAFVVRHLQSPAAKDDVESVYSRAKVSCPANLATFCSELADAARPK